MVPTLAASLSSRGLRASDSELAEYLAAMHALNARRNRRLLAEVGEITEALVAAGIRPIWLKGTALLLDGVHADPTGRFLGDVDLLLRPDEIEPAAELIVGLGYGRKPPGAAGAHDRVKLFHPERPAQVELHHPAVPVHLAAPLPPEAMRARAVSVAGLPGAAVPCPDDIVVHAVIHAMLHDWNLHLAELPMRDGLDLALLARRRAVDWEAVAGRLQRVPHGPAAYGFFLAATREAYPWADLPEVPVTGFAARSLRAWQTRAGRPTGRIRRRLANVVEHSARAWRTLGFAGRQAEVQA